MTHGWTDPWYELAAISTDGSIDRGRPNRFARAVPTLLRGTLDLPPGDYALRQWSMKWPPAPGQRIVELGMLTVRGPGRWVYCGLNGPVICPGLYILRRMR